MDHRQELRDFLKSRRARLQPQDVGLPVGGRRRVPGLRREELAQLAGVSIDYYVRFEQGRNPHMSQDMVDSIARALRLDEAERLHLHNLARPVPRRRRPEPGPRQRVPAGLRQLLDALSDAPAYVLGRRGDILAWNHLAAALLGDFSQLAPRARNIARLVFLDEASRSLYADWDFKAKGTVGLLRFDGGRHPDDPRLAELIGELSLNSPDFRRMWAAQEVDQKTRGRMPFQHPVIGPLCLDFETLRLPDDQDQMLVTYTAEPDSPDMAALKLLASWGTHPAPDGHHENDEQQQPAMRRSSPDGT